jgi:DNA replicative helicase MCM subunit Mcm2 (Cdc46/Mcm family)
LRELIILSQCRKKVSIVGHITKEELQRNLDETETANGFANRFLWIFTKRSKYLPEGGNLSDAALNYLVEKLNNAVRYARITNELIRNEPARQKWIEIYPKLSDGHMGLLGSVTSRAEAQVMRLACIYALFDCSEEIRLEHLDAALALWQYCEDSARYIFGNQTGNKIADAIYAALAGVEEGLNKTQIRDLFQRNASAGQINSALKLLIELGRINVIKEETDGRPREVFKLKLYDKNDFNDKSIQANT